MRRISVMRLKALMVDVDGVVVVHPDPKGWSANLERDLGLAPATLQAAFFKPHFGDIIHGRAGLHDRLAPVLMEIAPKLSSDELVRYWFEHDAHLDHGLLGQLAEIRRHGVELHLATVQEHLRADYLWRTIGLHASFDRMHYAADIGWAKPATEFFGEIEARTGFAPAELFFIDDKADNVRAAQQRGWRAAQWTGERRLGELLAEAGI